MKPWPRKLSILAGVSLAMFSTSAMANTTSLPVGRCVNLGNHLEPPKEGGWGGKILETQDMQRIATAGFNSVRLPVRWSTHAQLKAPYTIDPKFMARVQSIVGDARKAGLNVILNSHHFEEIHSDPSPANIARLAGMWTQIAATFANEPTANLWFEIENEPHDKFDDSNLLAVLTPALAEIRKTNPTRPVIIGGEKWSGINSLKSLKLPDDPNIIPTFHYYDAFDFTHQGATWVNPVPPMGRAYGSAADRKLLVDDVEKVRAYIKRTGKTPFMGEFGANGPIPLADRVAYQKGVRTAFDTLGIGMCAWAYTNTFPLWDQKTGAWLPGMRDAMGLAEPNATPTASNTKNVDPALQALDDATPGTLINDPRALDWTTHGKDQTSKTVKSPDIPGGGAAMQFTISRSGSNLYDSGANVPINAAIKSGTDVAALFWARTVQSADGKARIGVRFQQNSAPYPGFGDATLAIGPEWKQYQVAARADRAIANGQAVLAFQLAGGKQTIEIGQTIIVAGAKSVIAANAPATVELHPRLVGLGRVLTDYSTQGWPVYGAGASQKTVAAKEVPGGKAVQFNVATPPAQPFDLGLSVPVKDQINQGDTLVLAVLARTISSESADGKGKLGVRIQNNAPPYSGFADNVISVGPNWGLFQLRTKAQMAIPSGQGVVSVHLGGAKQVIEIGQVYLINTPPAAVDPAAGVK